LAFETLPRDGRGVFSGILQEGYAVGSILASVLYGVLFVHIGWRGLFVVGSLPAVLALYVQVRVPESPVWLAGRQSRSQRSGLKSKLRLPPHLREFLPTFGFLILLMTAFMSFSHGTQDLYPTFLEVHAHLTPEIVGAIGLLYGLTSVAGGYVFGALSERWGRKRAIVVAALLAIPVIPLFAYGASALELCIGAMLMQFMVQGAWGVVPAYLTELAPGPVRATAPGVAYTLGGLVTSWNGKGQALAAEHWHNYPAVLAWTVVIVALALACLAALGREAKGVEMTAV